MIDLVLHATLPETSDGRQSEKNTLRLFLVMYKGFDHLNVKNLWKQVRHRDVKNFYMFLVARKGADNLDMRCVRKQVEHRDAVAGVARVHEQPNVARTGNGVATNEHHFACFGEGQVFGPCRTKAVSGWVGNN